MRLICNMRKVVSAAATGTTSLKDCMWQWKFSFTEWKHKGFSAHGFATQPLLIHCLFSFEFLKAAYPHNAYLVTPVSFLTGFGRRCDSLFHQVAGKSLGISPINLVAQRKIQWERPSWLSDEQLYFLKGGSLLLTNLNISRWQLACSSKMDSDKFALIHTEEYSN